MNKKLMILIISTLVLLPLFLFADTEVEPNNTAGAAGVFTVENGMHDGEVNPGDDLDFFGFEASEGDIVEVSTLGYTTLDTKLWIYAEDGTTELAYNDDSGGTLQSFVTITPAEDGYFYFVVGSFGTGTGAYEVELSGATPPTHFDNDMKGRFVTGNVTPTDGEESNYTIHIKNQGELAQLGADYTVELYDMDDDLIGSVQGVDLGAGENGSVVIPWTPDFVGGGYIYGIVNLPGDENTENDMTDPLNVVVQASGTTVITIGSGTDLHSQIPINFFWNYSLTQTIYFPEEINTGGLLAAIQYYNSFGADYPTETIKVYLTHTSSTHLTAGYIPIDAEPVFDGVVAFPIGENDVLINLDTPFGYNGADNLLVTVLRESQEWASGNSFYVTSDLNNPNRSATVANDNNTYDPANPPAGPALINAFPNISLFFWGEATGSLDGYVYGNDREPLPFAPVDVLGTPFSTSTDDAGYYTLPYVFIGEQEVQSDYHGYYANSEAITIVEGQHTEQDIYLDQEPTVNVSGHVVTSDTGADVVGASVSLEGYEMLYEGITDASGNFILGGVYGDHTYDFTIMYEGYATYNDPAVAVGAVDLDLGEIIVEEIAGPVTSIIAEENHDGDALIVWNTPGGGAAAEFRWDDGISAGQLGYSNATQILGAVHLHHAMINEITWFSTDEGGPHTNVNIILLGCDDTGTPDETDILYQVNITDAVDMEWNVHELPEAIETPNGFFVGYNFNGFAGLSTDDGVDDYPYTIGTQLIQADWTDGSNDWETPDAFGFPFNFMIRAIGLDMGEVRASGPVVNQGISTEKPIFIANNRDQSLESMLMSQTQASRLLETYTLHRLLEGDQENPGAWTEIATGLTDTTYVDETWQSVPPGEYRYAVTAIYTNGIEADPGFSNIIAAQMTAGVTINVSTDSGDDPAGAMVVLTNQDGIPEHIYTMAAPTGGVVVFPEVWLGVYDLEVAFANHNPYEQMNINIFNVTTIPVELNEIILAPEALVAEGIDGGVRLSWMEPGSLQTIGL